MKYVLIHPQVVTLWREHASDSHMSMRKFAMWSILFRQHLSLMQVIARAWGSVTGSSKISLLDFYSVVWLWWTSDVVWETVAVWTGLKTHYDFQVIFQVLWQNYW